MRVFDRNGLRAVVLIAVAALPRAAAADPIEITGGHMETHTLSSLARGRLEGDGFLLVFGADAFAASIASQCWPCTAGTTVDLGGEFNFPRSSGSGLIDGVEYTPFVYLEMTGTFSAPSFEISGSETVTRSTPFTYSATIAGFLIDPWVHGPTEPVFTKTLFGQGTASARFIYFDSPDDSDPPTFTGTDLRYDFGSTAAPVPEPATLLLCGAGTAALAIRRRRQSRTRR